MQTQIQRMDLLPFIKTRCQAGYRGNGCAAVTQIPGLESNLCWRGRVTKVDCPELSWQPLGSEVCSQHDEGKGTVSGIHVINCTPRLIQEALSGNQQSLNLKRWEVTPSSFQDELQYFWVQDVILFLI